MFCPKFFVRLGGVLVAVLTASIIPSAAQQHGIPVDHVHAGTSLVALVGVAVRESAPGGGAIYVKGQQTGTLKPNEIIVVSKEQMVSTLLGSQKWVYFSRSEDLSPPRGWVLVGNTGSTSSNFGPSH